MLLLSEEIVAQGGVVGGVGEDGPLAEATEWVERLRFGGGHGHKGEKGNLNEELIEF